MPPREPEASPPLPQDGPLGPDLEARIAGLGLESRVRVLDPLPEDALVGVLRSAAVGVSPMSGPPGSNTRQILTNKVFQYLAAGLPQTAARSSAAAAFIEREAIGRAFEDGSAHALAEAVRTLDTQADTFAPDLAAALERHAWSAQADRVRESLMEWLGHSPAAKG